MTTEEHLVRWETRYRLVYKANLDLRQDSKVRWVERWLCVLDGGAERRVWNYYFCLGLFAKGPLRGQVVVV